MQYMAISPQNIKNLLSPNVRSNSLSVTKLCISPIISSLQSHDLAEYFTKFGGVDGCELHRIRHFGLAIVYFAKAEDAQNVLQKRYHRIKNCIVSVEPATDQSIKMITSNCMQNQTATHIFYMKDAILFKIFNNFGLFDLLSVANTCMRFNTVADKSFSAEYDKITVRTGNCDAEMVFQTFGHLVTRLDFDISHPADYYFDLLTLTCDTKLRNLSLQMATTGHTGLNRNIIGRLKVLFSQLECLQLNCRGFFDLETTKELLSSCTQLESLSINCSSFTSDIWNKLSINFPRLQELKFILNQSIDDEGLGLLLAFNPNIRRLYLDECIRLTPKAPSIIVHFLPNLQEITLGMLQNVHPKDLHPLTQLRFLKSVVFILGDALPLLRIIASANMPIENLELWHVNINDAHIEIISQIRSVKKLLLSSNMKDSYLNVLAANLPFLSELRLLHSNEVTVEGLRSMLFHANALTHLRLTNIRNIIPADKDRLLEFAQRYLNKRDLTIEIKLTS